jgi:hypothetical protein
VIGFLGGRWAGDVSHETRLPDEVLLVRRAISQEEP